MDDKSVNETLNDTESQSSHGDSHNSSSQSVNLEQGKKASSKQGLLGLALVGIGLLAVLTNIGDESGFLWTGMISAMMFFAYYRTKAYGFLIPACILAGVTAGIIFELLSPVEGVFLLGLGGGFIAIDRIQQEKSRWPLYPGIVLLAIGTVVTIQTLFNNMLFAIMLIVVGTFLLLRNRQVLDSMMDVKADIDIRIGDNNGEDKQANLKEERTQSFVSYDFEAKDSKAHDAAQEAKNDITVDVELDGDNSADPKETKAAKAVVVDIMPEDSDFKNTDAKTDAKSDDNGFKSSHKIAGIDVEIESDDVDDANAKHLDEAVSKIKEAVDKIVEDANLPKDDGKSS